ncbi:MAG TPA: hypothetical protein VFK44_02825 [Bacillales bacterium]|nr:hypothetical protein [Bacillales bacterium]
MKRIFLHVGFHKTATTFLQNSIYPNMTRVRYVPKDDIREDFRKVRLKRLTDDEIGKIRRRILSYDDGRPLLISFEGLSGSPFAPKKTKKQQAILEDLRRLFPAAAYDVSLIVGIREQVDLLTSLYIQHIHQGGVYSGPEYINYCERNGSLSNYQFDRYLDKVRTVFGDQFYVMIYERFKREFSSELQQLLDFLGEPEIPTYKDEAKWRNKSLGAAQAAIVRRLNRLVRTPIHPNGPLPVIEVPGIGPLLPRRLFQNRLSFALHYKKYRFPEDWQALLKQQYAASNRRLQDEYGMDLPDVYSR